MPYEQTYTFIDGTWHAIGWSEHTQCNIAIPFGNGYVKELPAKAKAHCGPDTKTAESDPEEADAAGSKAKADEHNAKKVGESVATVTGEAGEDLQAGEVAAPGGGKSKGK